MVISPGSRPCHDYHDASPYGQACARYSIVLLPSESFSAVVSPEPMGNTEDKRKECQRVFVLGLSVTFFFFFGSGSVSFFVVSVALAFLLGSHTAHSRFRLGWRREPCALLGRGPDLSVPLSRESMSSVWEIGGFGCVRKLHPSSRMQTPPPDHSTAVELSRRRAVLSPFGLHRCHKCTLKATTTS